jgi:hypothetical protein
MCLTFGLLFSVSCRGLTEVISEHQIYQILELSVTLSFEIASPLPEFKIYVPLQKICNEVV